MPTLPNPFSANEDNFSQIALDIFYFQATHCSIYQQFIRHLNIQPKHVKTVEQIPFLPIELFKNHKIYCGNTTPETAFRSSGTTQKDRTSTHFIKDLNLYQNSFTQGFQYAYGTPKDYAFLALLPSYIERNDSSLIYMMQGLMQQSGHSDNGFYLTNYDELYQKLLHLKATKQKTMLIGVTFALLDFTEQYSLNFSELIVLETGGMKGKRKEMVREELHQRLSKAFGISTVHSEYGMTELLSQAYSKGQGIFEPSPWMKIIIRDPLDPFTILREGKTGGINVIDLANLYSCSFLATQDLGKQLANNTFEILGRFDNSDIRGCNLMLSA